MLLDAGLFQGRRTAVREKNTTLPVDTSSIDAVVLSHAHIDHSGRLPFLARRGYAGPIFATPATVDLCRVMLADSAHIQEKDAEFLARRNRAHEEPLYDPSDAERAVRLMRPEAYGTTFDVVPGLRAQYVDAGHILGSASVTLEWRDGAVTQRLAFSGDIGRRGLAIIRDPVPPTNVDALIMESTYGNREHPGAVGERNRLATIVAETAARGGKILIPAFAVGRTQEIVYALHVLARERRIPEIPIVIDSPLAIEATAVFRQHADVFDMNEPLIREFASNPAMALTDGMVEYAQTPDESKAAMNRRGPMVIVAASGMAESGRILHHLLHGASNPQNTILIVGYQAEHTLGRRICERRPIIKVFGENVELRARVEILNGYSAHAGHAELLAWHAAVKRTSPRLRHTWLVHGEPEAQDSLAAELRATGADTSCPTRGATAEI
ncbi:MAG TPA: MBL fold metallo-hydrolase [Gemmatimonadaceae bacterium]|nr:MBL fold metallo-hydrolase [Gemmatimonadaceae bacterium]